jgi:hypothetical protein
MAHCDEHEVCNPDCYGCYLAGFTEKELAAQAKAETDAENAWMRHAERPDPEAQADLDLHDWLAGGE